MSELTTVARPYAKAAFDFAVEAKAIDDWQVMLAFAAEVSQNEKLISFLKGGKSIEESQDIFIQVCGEQLDSKGQNFIKVMAENERLLVLPQVAEQFSELKTEYEKTANVDVTSAVKLTKQQEVAISAALEKRLDRKVKLNCIVDASVVSGLLIKSGDMVIDGSLQGKLSRLATTLQS